MARCKRLGEGGGEPCRRLVHGERIRGCEPGRVAVGVGLDDHDIIVHSVGKDRTIEFEEERQRGGGEHGVWGRVDEVDRQGALLRLRTDVHGRAIEGSRRRSIARASIAREGDAAFQRVKPREMPRLDVTSGARRIKASEWLPNRSRGDARCE